LHKNKILEGERKMKKLFAILIMGLLVLSGCGTDEKASNEKKEKANVSEVRSDSKLTTDNKSETEDTIKVEDKEEAKSVEKTTETANKEENTGNKTVADSVSTPNKPKVTTSSGASKTPDVSSSTSETTTTQPKVSTSTTQPKPSQPAPTPAPAPQPTPTPVPAPTPQPAPAQTEQGSHTTKVQNALPGGYTAKSDGSSVLILKGGTQIASTLPGTVGFSASLDSTDIDAALKGASALGGNYSDMKNVVNTLLSGSASSSSGRTSGLKTRGMIFITW
jgi:FtsZ-interacting cell division protein ZipA